MAGDVIIAIKEARIIFASLTSKRVINIGHIVASTCPRRRISRKGNDVCSSLRATASISTPLDGFIAESFSSIRERIPDVELVLAGNVCNVKMCGSSSWGRSMTLPRFMIHLR